MTTYVLGGGCFWCLDAVFRRVKGVHEVVSGYSGGALSDPSYEQVCAGDTGHAEVVRISFDETIISSEIILDLFFLIHDPTTPNRQGNDVGPQYRSIMLYDDEAQQHDFLAARDRAGHVWDQPIVTEIVPLETFYVAEEYHQDYFNKNPGNGYCQVVVAPKIAKARAKYGTWLLS